MEGNYKRAEIDCFLLLISTHWGGGREGGRREGGGEGRGVGKGGREGGGVTKNKRLPRKVGHTRMFHGGEGRGEGEGRGGGKGGGGYKK